FHDETGRLNVDGMNIISNDGSNKLNRSRKARVSYKVQRTINASLNAATSTRAVSKIGRASCREREEMTGVEVEVKRKGGGGKEVNMIKRRSAWWRVERMVRK